LMKNSPVHPRSLVRRHRASIRHKTAVMRKSPATINVIGAIRRLFRLVSAPRGSRILTRIPIHLQR
jgi:hypothetical protein